MKLFKSKPIIHHFKVHFPIPSSHFQSCLNKIQQLSPQNTEAIFLSLNGFILSPQMAQTLHNGFQTSNSKWKIPVFTFLQQYTTSLTYFSSTCGTISANPYCIIGDVGTTHKTYTNIQKLMKFLNIKVDLLAFHKDQTYPWNPFTAPTEQQKQLSHKWLNTVQQNMIKTISQNRNIPIQKVRELKSKLLTPQQALSNRLIDHIQTAEQFKETHFPQVKIREHLFATTSKVPNLASSQIKVLMQIEEVLSMPRIALLSMQDPFNQCIRELVELIKIRAESPEKIEEIDTILGNMFNKIQLRMEGSGQFIF